MSFSYYQKLLSLDSTLDPLCWMIDALQMQPVPLNWESAICEENNIEYFWQKDKRKTTWKSPNETYFKAIAKRIRTECSQMSFNSIEYCFTVRPCLSVVIFYKLSCYLQLEDQLYN